MSDDLDLEGISPIPDEGETEFYPREGGVFEVGEDRKAKKYAWGLIWGYSDGDPTTQTMKTSKKSALAKAEENHADLYCIPSKGTYALGSTTVGHTKGMKPIATVIRDSGGQISSDCLMAFKLEGYGVYVLGIDRDGHIIAETDILFYDDMAAKDYFIQLQGQSEQAQWKNLRAPDDWGIPGAKTESFELIANSSRSSCKLKETSNTAMYKNLAILAVVVAIIGGLYFAYSQWQAHEQQVAQQKQAALQRQKAAHLKQMAQQRINKQGWPFDHHEKGVAAIVTCQSAMMGIPTILPEYTLVSLTCSPDAGSVTALFKAHDATTPFVYVSQYVNAMTTMHTHILHGKGTVSVIYPFREAFDNPKYHYGVHDKTGNVDEQFAYLDEYFNSLRGKVKFIGKAFQPAPLTPAKRKDQLAEQQTVFKTMTFKMSSIYTPDNFVEALAPLPVFTVSDVTYEVAKKTWSISGTIYESLLQSDIDKIAVKTNGKRG